MPDKQGFLPLHLAVSTDKRPVVALLLERGAPLEAKTPAGGTALHVAAAHGHAALAHKLLEAGAELEALDNDGATPLLAAAAEGRLATAKALLKAGASVVTTNKWGENALILALRKAKKLRVTRWFSEGEIEGTPVEYEIVDGKLSYYRAGEPKFISDKDARFVAKKWCPAQHAYNEALDLVKKLIRDKAEVNAVDCDGFTPLHEAGRLGEMLVLEPLIRAGAQADTPSKFGITPLHCVAGSRREDGLRLFLTRARPLPVNAPDQAGFTPLHELGCNGGTEEMVAALLGWGADRAAKLGEGYGKFKPGFTPADCVEAAGHQHLVAPLTV